MGDPPLGQNVVVTLADGGTLLACWDGEKWMVGVEGNPQDEPLAGEAVSWSLLTSEV